MNRFYERALLLLCFFLALVGLWIWWEIARIMFSGIYLVWKSLFAVVVLAIFFRACEILVASALSRMQAPEGKLPPGEYKIVFKPLSHFWRPRW